MTLFDANPHAGARLEAERTAPCPAGPGTRCAICGAETVLPDPSPLDLTPLGRRPSWSARLQLMAQAWVTVDVRNAHGDTDAAEWFMARARRQFREGLWADEAATS